MIHSDASGFKTSNTDPTTAEFTSEKKIPILYSVSSTLPRKKMIFIQISTNGVISKALKPANEFDSENNFMLALKRGNILFSKSYLLE